MKQPHIVVLGAGFAPGLKSLEDAINIRRKILLAFERAENTPEPAEQAPLLTMVIVGVGPGPLTPKASFRAEFLSKTADEATR